MRSVPVDDSVPYHRVAADYKNNLMSKPKDTNATTLFEMVDTSFSQFASNDCMRTRKFLGWKSVKPPVKHFEDAITSYTYKEIGDMSYKFGAALRKEGLVPAPEVATLDAMTTPCSLAIFENTSKEWMISAVGAFSQSIVVTTIYATLGMDAVVTAIQDGVISAIVCNKKSVKDILSRKGDMKTLNTIIYTSDIVADDEKIEFGPVPKGVKVVSFEDFTASGDVTAFPPTPPKPSTMSVLMYTSGSTGKPKGVVITHGQMVAAAAALEIATYICPEDTHLGYLPLAHIMELTAEITLMSKGAAICYADPKTLTAKGSFPKGALEAFAPTVLIAVPKIWDVIKKGVEGKIAASKPIAQFLVATAFQWRSFLNSYGMDTVLFKALVFKKFSVALGGKMNRALSGGGPLNLEVQSFIRTCFGIPLVQGYVSCYYFLKLLLDSYFQTISIFKSCLLIIHICFSYLQGLTETNAGLTVQDFHDSRAGVAGVPIPSVTVKLLSVPDINDKAGLPYLNTDTKDVDGNKVFGRGEVLVKGHSLSLGYYMMPDKTKEVFLEDGFFRTGDVGQFMEDGSVRIVDRVKNLVKLKGGEYIAIENMEMTYGNSKFVDAIAGGICCYGDGDMDRPIALLQLSEPVTMAWAKENNVSGDFETVKESKELYDFVLADMRNEHKKANLSHLEKLVAICFLTDPWTPENGCLTAANKLQRRAVVEKFSKEFEATKAKGIF